MGTTTHWVCADLPGGGSAKPRLFPSGKEYNQETWLNYLYLSFTIGVSFSTSDVTVVNHKGRRVMLLHSILSFFYNAIIVAMALQVIQGTR